MERKAKELFITSNKERSISICRSEQIVGLIICYVDKLFTNSFNSNKVHQWVLFVKSSYVLRIFIK